MQFLMGLDESYTNVRGQILLMQPLLIVSKAYSMLRQEEKQRDTQKPNTFTPTALNTSSNRFTSQPQNSQNKVNTTSPNHVVRKTPFRKGVYFTNCSKEEHYGNECYKLVGYPPGHPLHKKYIPPSQRAKGSVVNMITSTEEVSDIKSYVDPNTGTSTSTDPFVHTRMDMLQNQLNQVL